METIIQQIAEEFIKTITKKAMSEEIFDIDALACVIEKDCKAAARQVVEAVAREINLQIREDKEGRKLAGLVLKEKERARSLYTKLGVLSLPRDYYQDKKEGKYVALLDKVVGIESYVRVGHVISADMVNLAADVSYAKSAAISTGGQISRQSVRNRILKLRLPEEAIPEEKKEIKELHIYADEDHVHMQKPGKQRGKKSQIVPLVTVTEGTLAVSERRNKTIGTMRFVDEEMDTKRLWKKVEGYIGGAYESETLEKIYVHGDGGRWIKNSLGAWKQTVHVMDGYHFEKRLKDISKRFPKKNVRVRLKTAINRNDKTQADDVLQHIMAEADEKGKEKVLEFGTYLMCNWEEIYRRETLDIPGSCTEGQVSHVLSERFSRNPMGWSKEGLGKLSCIRVSAINGRKIEAEDFKQEGEKEGYIAYADKLIQESIAGAFDWSIFNGEPLVFDGASGTQILIKAYGKRGALMS